TEVPGRTGLRSLDKIHFPRRQFSGDAGRSTLLSGPIRQMPYPTGKSVSAAVRCVAKSRKLTSRVEIPGKSCAVVSATNGRNVARHGFLQNLLGTRIDN